MSELAAGQAHSNSELHVPSRGEVDLQSTAHFAERLACDGLREAFRCINGGETPRHISQAEREEYEAYYKKQLENFGGDPAQL